MVMSQSFASGMNLISGPHVFTVDKATGNLTLRWAIAGSVTVAYFNKGYNSTFTANKTFSSPTLKNQDADERIVSLTDNMLSSSVSLPTTATTARVATCCASCARTWAKTSALTTVVRQWHGDRAVVSGGGPV
ncbi:hypothetical protein CFC21_108134 [Triticum aestivum]|uniref:Legume lectin domain-containing protein n=2 Tax=Triticum aestivum TaxID=4565 RepID=A0A9R1MHG2_WHEAT|nr:hypothetical protein CFC21_108134 [Triticum aestivum]